jgi:hypothetical protein
MLALYAWKRTSAKNQCLAWQSPLCVISQKSRTNLLLHTLAQPHFAPIKRINIAPFDLSPSQELSIPWKHGIDIAWSSKVITSVDAPEIVESSFERVRGGFGYKVGQKIGIGVYSDIGATKTTAGNPNVSKEEVARIYGPPKTSRLASKGCLVCSACLIGSNGFVSSSVELQSWIFRFSHFQFFHIFENR